jgi:hypothetical protein
VIQNAASVAWTWIKDRIASIWEGIKTGVKKAANWVKDTVAGIWDKVKTKASNVWSAIGDGIRGAWEGIKSKVRSGVNGVISIMNTLIGGVNWVLRKLHIPEIPTIGSVGSTGRRGAGGRPSSRLNNDIPPQIAHWAGQGGGSQGTTPLKPGDKGSGLGDIPVVSDVIKAVGDMASDPVGFLKRGAIKAAFGPVNSAAKSALNAVPIGFVRDIAQAVRQRIWDWATSEDDKLPTEAAGGTASGLVGFAAAHYGSWKQMFPWMTIRSEERTISGEYPLR